MSKDAGLDLHRGDHASSLAFSMAKETFGNREGRAGDPVQGASFANVMRYGDQLLAMCTDGIGTKAEVAERTGIYDTLGFDLLAMVVDDLACVGAEPTNITNVLGVNVIDSDVVDALMRGLAKAAEIAKVAVIGGEIAELGDRVQGWGQGMHLHWSATAVGVVGGEGPIDGSAVRPGDAIVGLQSAGFRANGFSLVRRELADRYGNVWHAAMYDDERTWGEVVLTPSVLYTPLVGALLDGGLRPHAIAHITGGGIGGNLMRVLGTHGALLDDLFPPHDAMKRLQAIVEIPEPTAYSLWNMGTGMFLVVDPAQLSDVLALASDLGYRARRSGEVTDTDFIEMHTLGRSPAHLAIRRRH